jgi:hypothetical protein
METGSETFSPRNVCSTQFARNAYKPAHTWTIRIKHLKQTSGQDRQAYGEGKHKAEVGEDKKDRSAEGTAQDRRC